jgi:hypothetical protein
LAAFLGVFAMLLILNWNGILPDEAADLPILLMLSIGLPALVVVAARAPRLQWRTLLMLYPAATFFFALAGATAYAPDYAPPRIGTPYRYAQKMGARELRFADDLARQGDAMRELRQRFDAGENVVPPRSTEWTKLEIKKVATRAEAERAWKHQSWDYEQSAANIRAQAERLLSLRREEWWKGMPTYAIGTQVILAPLMAVLLALSLIGGLGARVWDRWRMKRV